MKNLYSHERDRIHQFIVKAGGDEQKLRQLLLVRAGRCGAEKLERFITALKEMHLEAIASWIEVLMVGNSSVSVKDR